MLPRAERREVRRDPGGASAHSVSEGTGAEVMKRIAHRGGRNDPAPASPRSIPAAYLLLRRRNVV